MTKLKVIHERPDCISCGACAAILPEFWEMDEDGLSTLKGATKVGENFELEISSDDKAENEEAAEVCPVQIIHVREVSD
ncbi:ferredoxin [archaeon]|jgi:ferredoxin|nr:ferredoxin [archaeon]MBT6761941.1 ferredoxin [archaeon]